MIQVLTSTHNLCFEQKYEAYQNNLSEFFHFWVVKFSGYLNRHVFVMHSDNEDSDQTTRMCRQVQCKIRRWELISEDTFPHGALGSHDCK